MLLIPRSPSTARTFRTWKEKKSEAEISVYLWISLDILLQGRRSLGWGVLVATAPLIFCQYRGEKSQIFVAILENQNFTIVPQQNFLTFRYTYIAHFFYNNNHDIEGLLGYGYSMTSQWDKNFSDSNFHPLTV